MHDWFENADLILIVGCSGNLFLANHLVEQSFGKKRMIIIDPERQTFVRLVEQGGRCFIQGTNSEVLPHLFRLSSKDFR